MNSLSRFVFVLRVKTREVFLSMTCDLSRCSCHYQVTRNTTPITFSIFFQTNKKLAVHEKTSQDSISYKYINKQKVYISTLKKYGKNIYINTVKTYHTSFTKKPNTIQENNNVFSIIKKYHLTNK